MTSHSEHSDAWPTKYRFTVNNVAMHFFSGTCLRKLNKNVFVAQYMSRQVLKKSHAQAQGLRTPNEGINQIFLNNWADVADKICCGCT